MSDKDPGKPPKHSPGPKEPEKLEKARKDLYAAATAAAASRKPIPKESLQALRTAADEKRTLGLTAYTRKNTSDFKDMELPKGSNGGTRRNKTSGGDIVSHLLTIRNQVKLYHWQTGSFARHKATDDLTAALDTNIDAFVESYMGRYGRPKVSGSIKLHNFSESAARAFVAKQTKYLSSELPRKIKSTDTDLLNIRDEILGDLNKVLYLFTLH